VLKGTEAARRTTSQEESADAPHLPRLLRLDDERRGERPSQRGQQEATAVHYSIT
jgi:hypothetical protein